MNKNNSSITEELISMIRDRLDRPVTLVGMMGVGKSHTGKKLAESLNLKFQDADSVIEKKTGYLIPEIFEKFGEEKFRLSEARIVQELLNEPPCVIATGGGALINAETRKAVFEKSISVWLRAEKAELVRRLKNSRDRPLLQNGNIEETIDRLLSERQSYYEESDIVVDVVEGSVPKTVNSIIKSLSEYYKK